MISNCKVRKKIKTIALIIGITLPLIIIAPFILLNISAVQEHITQNASKYVSNILGTDFRVESIRLKHLTRLDIESASLSDLNHQKTLAFKALKIHIRLLPLLKGEIALRKVEIDDLYANLYYDKDTVINIQFLIDALTPKEKATPPDLDLPNIILNNAEINYFDWRKNANIKLRELNTDIKFRLHDRDCIDLNIKKFNVSTDQKALIRNIQLDFNCDKEKMQVRNLTMDLKTSHIQLDDAEIIYKHLNDTTIDWGNSEYKVNLAPSQLYLSDLGFIEPKLKSIQKPINLELHAEGTFDDINAQKIYADYNKDIVFYANLDIKGINKLDSASGNFDIRTIRFSGQAISEMLADFTGRTLVLPTEIKNLGVCNYVGTIDGNIKNINLEGTLSTAVGNVEADAKIQSTDTFKTFDLSALVNTTSIALNKIINDPELGLGPTQIQLETDAHFESNDNFDISLKGNVAQMTFKNYTYNNIRIDGNLKPKRFDGNLKIRDTNGDLDFDGTFDMNDQMKNFVFTSNIQHLNINKLNLTDQYPNLNLSLAINSNIKFKDIESLNGSVIIDSLSIVNGLKSLPMTHFGIMAVNNPDTNNIQIESDYINGNIYGKYKISELKTNIIKTLSKNMPILNNLKVDNSNSEANITATFEVSALKSLMDVLDVKWHTTEPSTIHLSYKSNNNYLSSYVSIPHISNGAQSIDSIILNVNNLRNLRVNIQATTDLQIGHVNTNLNLSGNNDTITSSLYWTNNSKKMFTGELLAKTKLNVQDNHVNSSTLLYPTEFELYDQLWKFSFANLYIKPNMIEIKNFNLFSSDANQSIMLNGIISENAFDELNAAISNLSLDEISSLLPEETAKSLSFGGNVSAKGNLGGILTDNPRINAEAHANNFSFNNVYFGSLDAKCDFDTKTNNLNFKGFVYGETDTTAYLKGNIHKDSIDIKGLADGFNLAILDYYLESTLGSVTGKGYGDVHIHGKNKKIAVDVDAFAENASITINALGSTIHFSDSIHLDKSLIDFGEIEIYDDYGNKGNFSGSIHHNYLKQFNLDLGIHVDKMMVMNTTVETSPSFYGKIFATGDVAITGKENSISITGLARTENASSIVIPIDNYTAKENSFITFVNTNKDNIISTQETNESQGDLLINLMLDVSPETQASIITNSKSGDMLKANATGNLKLTYDVKNEDIKMYGNLQIIQGSYLFTLQEIIRKEFKFEEGGTISWSGNPVNANLNMIGYYQLNADLAELLDEALLTNVSRTTVPVQCVLGLSGILTQPNIKFDIKLPNSDEELQRAVNNTINTPEMMNRQIIGLLLLGKFFRPENEKNSSFISQNELYSMVSSTVSAQLNNWASQMFDKWGFGVNIRRSGEGETLNNEYEFNFQYAPTNRLVINGNVGYRDNGTNQNNFIGDFDLEYKLIQSGRLRIKAYTHTNDYKEFKKGLTTQGVGLVWTESFNNGKELRETWKENAKQKKIEREKKKAERKAKAEKKKAAKAAQKTISDEEKATTAPR